jgi:hypothetical protein
MPLESDGKELKSKDYKDKILGNSHLSFSAGPIIIKVGAGNVKGLA